METTAPALNYLNNGHSLSSWLLTKDHKRIALLYLASITVFFFLGGFFALMIRLELLTPHAKVVAGFQPIMPTFQGLVTEEQLLQLIAYVKSLGDPQGATK